MALGSFCAALESRAGIERVVVAPARNLRQHDVVVVLTVLRYAELDEEHLRKCVREDWLAAGHAADDLRAILFVGDVANDKPRVRHLKRGTFYRVLSEGVHLQSSGGPVSEDAPLTLYESEAEGRLTVRPTAEFKDGRFEFLKED